MRTFRIDRENNITAFASLQTAYCRQMAAAFGIQAALYEVALQIRAQRRL